MIVRPCITHVSGCPCINDDPFANFSSEAPDPADVIRMVYTAADPGMNANENFWDNPIGLGACSDADPQTAADCAQGQSFQDSHIDQPVFRSRATTCNLPCPSGGSYTYSLPAGAITALTQALADYLAQSICVYRASQAPRCAPIAITSAASNVESTSATLNGTVNPNGAATTYFFEWGTSTSYGTLTPITSVGSGRITLPASANIIGLTAGTTYHCRIVAINPQGTTFGADVTFKKAGGVQIVDLDSMNDLADNAGIIVGDKGGFAAFFSAGATTVVHLGGDTFGFFEAVSPNGKWLSGDIDGGGDRIVSYDTTSGVVRNLGFPGFVGEDVTDDGAILGSNVRLIDATTGAVISNLTVGALPFESILFDFSVVPIRALNNVRKVIFRDVGNTQFIRWQLGVHTPIATPASGDYHGFSPPGRSGISETGHVFATFIDNFARNWTFFFDGVAASIGDFGGFVTGYAIAPNADIVVGQADNGLGYYTAFIWKKGVGISLLPDLAGITPGTQQVAFDVNSSGWVVGVSDSRGFLYKPDGSMTAIIDLLTALDPNWNSVQSALFINENNQIAGFGTYLGVANTGYLLSL